MLKPIEYQPEARLDLIESVRFYEERQAGLGGRFLTAVLRAEASIRQHPDVGTPDVRGTRRARVALFPYGIVYKAYGHAIVVFAVVNFSKRPGFWHGRI